MLNRLSVLILLLFVVTTFSIAAQKRQVKLRLLETSDIHANFFPRAEDSDAKNHGGMARIASFLKTERVQYGDNLILVDNGDILQGQPSTYYYNFIDTISTHICAEVLNYLDYDAGNIGNHDIEVGRNTMNRWIADCNFPILGANVIDVATHQPAYDPYCMIERGGARIAILGLITPAIPAWLHEGLWKGLYFTDMEETARHWMKIIKETEKPDAIIGLFHTGQNAALMHGKFNENAALTVAKEVAGFDAVLFGHDHRPECKTITNIEGNAVWMLNPGSDGRLISALDMDFVFDGDKLIEKSFKGENINITTFPVDNDFMKEFTSQQNLLNEYISRKIGFITERITTNDVYFGPTSFINLIHQLQLEITGAEISLTAPLAIGTTIEKGDITIGDMFRLYKYENLLYVMELNGQEIKDLLEESYSLWTNQMKTANDNLLLFRVKKDEAEPARLANFTFDFDSAAGINYTVDVTQPKGSKINITSTSDGTPFDLGKTYRVAVNSYRGNGGGELLTRGAGIPQEKLKDRILTTTDKDLRYYLIKHIESTGTIVPSTVNNWQFIPEEWTVPATKRDYELLFNK